jgi:hypothetical protein
MTKADLITIIADELKFPWARAELLVDVVFDCMEQSMSRGEKIEIRATRPNYPYTQGRVINVNYFCRLATTISSGRDQGDERAGDSGVPEVVV